MKLYLINKKKINILRYNARKLNTAIISFYLKKYFYNEASVSKIPNQTVSPNKHFKLAQQTVHYVQSIYYVLN